MGNLYFEDSYGEKRLVAEGIIESMIDYHMMNYIHFISPNYKVYYTRVWMEEPGVTRYDVGSHSEFFIYEEE